MRRSGWLEVLWIRFWIRFSNSWIDLKDPLNKDLKKRIKEDLN